MTGVWNWGYNEGVKSAAFWGWFGEPGKPVHAWAKAASMNRASRVADNRVVYRGAQMGMVCRVNAGSGGKGGFGEPKRRSKWSELARASKAGPRTGEGRSVHDDAGQGAIADARQKAQRVETGTDTAKVLIRKNGGI
ncbi:MAG: hypothetical protein HY955_07785 [Deltaproteobacteria bacterium]|nr:hypothetical protein [Deltaproteobacteria bacterium]